MGVGRMRRLRCWRFETVCESQGRMGSLSGSGIARVKNGMVLTSSVGCGRTKSRGRRALMCPRADGRLGLGPMDAKVSGRGRPKAQALYP